MPAEPHALSTVQPPETPAEADYDAICAAVTATARGRWFLDEFTKRNRNSDTTQVLAAIAEMRSAVVTERVEQASREAHQEVRIELLEMARTIAQARAEVAEGRPAPAQTPASATPGAAPASDVAAAAERLRQIAWTIRACGIELPAAEQIGEIAHAILSADALRGLGDQRAQKLTEALQYLEHRIERMLDGHRPAATNDVAQPIAHASPPNDTGREPAPVTLAVAMIAAALRPGSAETGAVPAAAASPAEAEATATTMARGALASDTAEYPIDDDVVLTVADSVIEAPGEPAPIGGHSEPEPVAPRAASAVQAERVELELEPLIPARLAAQNNEPEFAGLELEPLAVTSPVAAVLAAGAHLAVEATPDVPAAADAGEPPTPDVPVAADAGEPPTPDVPVAADIAELLTPEPPMASDAGEPLTPGVPVAADAAEPLAPPAATIVAPIAEPAAEPIAALAAEPAATDSEANDNLPMMLVAQAGITTETDTIARQVDQDLDGLTDPVPDETIADIPAAPQPVMAPAARAQIATTGEPVDTPVEPSPQQARVSAAVAGAQAARAQLSDTLAAIESELFGSTRPDAGTDSSTAIPAAAAKPAASPVAAGPLAALMAMSEEERIALFS